MTKLVNQSDAVARDGSMSGLESDQVSASYGLPGRPPTCPRCSRPMRREQRSLLQKILYARVYQCVDCGHTSRVMRRVLSEIFCGGQ